ncbi:hypothetical protein BVC80_9099g52 [Macleaya cordata]|uniref:Uncharacterized protein n=1 Tax=Macleaya cordata TaxID=56857 RepID=A0A200PVL2_MACCD|nr:hypothetical protein BVC80_9099g52 [Macleaya cordata]
MGGSLNKQIKNKACSKHNFIRVLTEKIRLLEEEMSEIRVKREKESEVHEQQLRVFGVKEAEWKHERKRLRDEVKRLKKKLEEKEERIRGLLMEDDHDHDDQINNVSEKSISGKQWQLIMGANYNYNFLMMEQMREEQLRREEAVEKWKRLYLAIKTELDDLIQRTCRGVYYRVEDETMEELQREVKAKEETIEFLKARVAAMEEEGKRTKTEIDILKQSLRIISHSKRTKNNITKSLSGLRLHL